MLTESVWQCSNFSAKSNLPNSRSFVATDRAKMSVPCHRLPWCSATLLPFSELEGISGRSEISKAGRMPSLSDGSHSQGPLEGWSSSGKVWSPLFIVLSSNRPYSAALDGTLCSLGNRARRNVFREDPVPTWPRPPEDQVGRGEPKMQIPLETKLELSRHSSCSRDNSVCFFRTPWILRPTK